MKTIKINNSISLAIVDDEDFEYLSLFEWSLNAKGYPQCWAKPNTHSIPVGPWKMHNMILVKIGRHITGFDADHIDRNKLNNTRANLRSVPRSENRRNASKVKGTSSGYKNISWSKARGKWQVKLTINYKALYVGSFPYKDIALAIAARDAKVKELGLTPVIE